MFRFMEGADVEPNSRKDADADNSEVEAEVMQE